MGSLEAMKEGSAARYGHLKSDLGKKSTAEGIEALKELAGSASETINVLAGGIRSGMGYLGASDLSTLCLLYTSPSPRDATLSRMPSSA